MKIVGLFLIDSQVIAKHIDFDSHMGKIESQTAMRTRINYALLAGSSQSSQSGLTVLLQSSQMTSPLECNGGGGIGHNFSATRQQRLHTAIMLVDRPQ